MVRTDNLVALENAPEGTKFLGRLLWYTISDMRINMDEIKEAFATAGVDEQYLPKPINARDAFRRATKEAEAKRIPMEEAGQYLNLMVREVAMDSDRIVRQLVREVVDSKNTRLEYLPIVEVSLYGENDFRTDMKVVDISSQELDALAKIRTEFEQNKDHYNGRHIRDLVQRILSDCHPISVRSSGGVYFTPRAHEIGVNALQRLVKNLAPFGVSGDRTRLWTVPVVDADDQREMLSEGLEDQVNSESNALIKEITDIIKSGRKVKDTTARDFAQRARDLREKVKEYEVLLNDNIGAAQANLDLAMQAAVQLLERIDVA